jgi:nucleotide-binding universal stress UspA family protein
MPYKNILIALAGEDEENNVIHEAVRLATALDAELSAFHVNDPAAGKAHLMMDTLPTVTENDIRQRFRKLGYDKHADAMKVAIVESNDYPEEIAKATDDADLLVIGHKNKNRFLAALIDSVDERVSDMVSAPILVISRI